MRDEQFGTERSGKQPVTRDGDTLNSLHGLALVFLPALKVHRTRKGCHGHELSEGEIGLFRQSGRSFESVLAIGGESEDE